MAIKDYFGLLRPFNCLMAAIAVFIGASSALGAPNLRAATFLAMLSAFLICGGGQAINDFFDYDSDRKKNPNKPLPSGRIARNKAFFYSIFLFLLGNLIAYLINTSSFFIAILFTVLLVAYSSIMRNFKFLGNWVVASGTAATIIFGASVEGNYYLAIPFALSALFANAAREITKDFEDIDSDKGFKKTLPLLIGQKAKIVVGMLYAASFLIAASLWLSGQIANLAYTMLVIFSGVLFTYSTLELKLSNFKLSQNLSKAGMFLALLAFLAEVVM